MLSIPTLTQGALATSAVVLIAALYGLYSIRRGDGLPKTTDRDVMLERLRARGMRGDTVSKSLRGPRVLMRAIAVAIFILVLFVIQRSGIGF